MKLDIDSQALKGLKNVSEYGGKHDFISGAQLEIFYGRGDFVDLGHFNKVFVKNAKEKAPQANNLETFSPRYSSNYLLNGRFNPSMNTIRVFFSKIRALFSIFKKRQGRVPPWFLYGRDLRHERVKLEQRNKLSFIF